MSQPELVKTIAVAFDAADVPYMLTGSVASSLQGQPRSSHDIDVVALLTPGKVKSLLSAFGEVDFYVDEDAVLKAVRTKSMFNIISLKDGDKIDVWLLTDDAFDRSRFQRRQAIQWMGKPFLVSSPEDTILMKLLWAKRSGGSEKQYKDALNVYRVQFGTLNESYLDAWAAMLQVTDTMEKLRNEASKS